MKLVHVKELNDCVELKNKLNVIGVESKEIYKHLCFNIEESITLSKNNQVLDLDKYGLLLHNPIELKLNDKKFLNFLYKLMESNLDDECKQYIAKIEGVSLELLELLAYKTGMEIVYNHDLDFAKFLAAYNLNFDEPDPLNYVELLIRYCKLAKEILKIECIFSFGISDLLTDEEIKELNYQLSQLDLDIIDFVYINGMVKKTFVIDDDWCII